MMHLIDLILHPRGKDIALAVAQGLYYLHSHAVLHLDIKVQLLKLHAQQAHNSAIAQKHCLLY